MKMTIWIGGCIINATLAICLMGLIFKPGFSLGEKWDSPTLASFMLGAATVVLTGVAVLAALLSVWGFATLREHAGKIATEAAESALKKMENLLHESAEAAALRAIKNFPLPDPRPENDIAAAYGRE